MGTRIPFNNDWIFNEDFDRLPEGKSVRIPHTAAETPFHYFDESVYQMVCGYQKTFAFPKEAEGKKLFLVFEGAAHYAEVFVNDIKAASHGCGYTAFEADITDYVRKDGLNEVRVKLDSRETLNIPPFGFVIDYMTYGGIYREVYLDIRSRNYISDVFARGSAEGVLNLDVTFSETEDTYSVSLREKDSGKELPV